MPSEWPKRATTFNPTDKRVWENYGLVLGQEGKFDDARAQFETAAKLDPKDATPVVLEARAYVSQRALALAAQDFDRALVIDPKSTEAELGKASLLAASHDVKGAIAAYEQLYALETTDETKAAVILQEFTLYRDEKMNDDALVQIKRADAAFPGVASVHLAYGDYYFQVAKDSGAAESEWKIALGPNRDNPQALDRLENSSFHATNQRRARLFQAARGGRSGRPGRSLEARRGRIDQSPIFGRAHVVPRVVSGAAGTRTPRRNRRGGLGVAQLQGMHASAGRGR